MNKIRTILVTGSSGGIGRSLCSALSATNTVLGYDKKNGTKPCSHYTHETGDIVDFKRVNEVCRKHAPDVVIHCAGIAHQRLNSGVSPSDYERVNHAATVNLARCAVNANPSVHFIFLSTISVYGERFNAGPVSEESECHASSPYAMTKLKAEQDLIGLSGKQCLKKLDILRLAPVYDRKISLNLDKRVFSPGKLCYVRFGTGTQKMSVLYIKNLTGFIDYILQNAERPNGPCYLYNVADAHPYTFNQIIRIFKRSQYRPARPVIPIPMGLVRFGIKFLSAIVFPQKRVIDSWYDKLALDLVFDNKKMLETGYYPDKKLDDVF